MPTPRYRCRWNWGGGGSAGIRREIKRNKGERRAEPELRR
uniref:Uncharacterized protein n=1 Tax=Arundo donax TaxID=35708 RepID=A0A0A9FJ46_ARUDO